MTVRYCAINYHPHLHVELLLYHGQKLIKLCSQEHRREYEQIYGVTLTEKPTAAAEKGQEDGK